MRLEHASAATTPISFSTTRKSYGQNRTKLSSSQLATWSSHSGLPSPPRLPASVTPSLWITSACGESRQVSASLVSCRLVLMCNLPVLNHLPISAVGCRQVRHFDLSLVRYDVPSSIPIPSGSDQLVLLQTNKVRAPKLRYSIHPPKSAIGPMDLVSIPLHLQPLDHDVSIRSASVVVERRITLNDNPTPSSSWLPLEGLYSKSSNSSLQKPSPSPRRSSTSPSPSHSPSWNGLPLPSESDLAPSPHSAGSTVTPDASYLSPTSESSPMNSPASPHSSPCKVVTNPIASAESSGNFVRDQNGVYSKTLTLQWPSAKSRSLWAIGETVTSDLVSVKFFLRTKVRK